MNNSFVRLVQGMNHTLRSEVLPRLDDEYARGQVWGLINLLNTFEKRADWSAGFLLLQLQAQQAALEQAAVLLDRTSPVAATCAAASASVAELLAQRDNHNLAMAALFAELDGAGGTDGAHGAHGAPAVLASVALPLDSAHAGAPDAAAVAARRAQALALLRRAMRTEVDLELQHSPRPLFAQMSGAAE
jgi:hypothetical protein